MIPEKLKNLTPLICAYLNGERVQIKIISEWRDISSIASFNAFNNEFRIYKEPKLVPFAFEDNLLFRDKWIYSEEKELPGVMRIISYNESNVHVEFGAIGYAYLLNKYRFEDGSPCGKYINK